MSDSKIQLLKLSASAIKSYESCPRKYYFNYIQRAPKKQWEHFDLGNLCHKALELFHDAYIIDSAKHVKASTKPAKKGTKKFDKLLGEMMGDSFSKARKSFPRMSDELVLDAKSMLIDYLGEMKTNGMPNVKGVETKFDFRITDQILVRGVVDRVDIVKDGIFRIVDYKTTKSVQFLDEFQLLLYGAWLKRMFDGVEKFKAAYVLLRHKSIMKEYEFNMEDVDKVENKIIEFAESINTDKKWDPIPTRLCNWCDFKDICPAHKTW